MPLKFNCCSDTHAWFVPALADSDAKAWLHAGDVYDHGRRNLPEMMHPKLDAWMAARTIPVHAVKGNHDCSLSAPFFDKFGNASGRCIEIEPGLLLLGIGWAGGIYYDLPTESDILKVCDEIRKEMLLKSNFGDKIIVLTHYPPWSDSLYENRTRSEGWMFEQITALVDQVKPLALIQGHVHGLFGEQMIYEGDGFETLIVSPGPYGGVLTVDPAANTAEFQFTPEAIAKHRRQPPPVQSPEPPVQSPEPPSPSVLPS